MKSFKTAQPYRSGTSHYLKSKMRQAVYSLPKGILGFPPKTGRSFCGQMRLKLYILTITYNIMSKTNLTALIMWRTQGFKVQVDFIVKGL